MRPYEQMIRKAMAVTGSISKADPRHVEAWMREDHYTLDALSEEEFVAAVVRALECCAEATSTENESLAASHGL